MRLIDADKLIEDLEYDIRIDEDILMYEGTELRRRENAQFDKDCKQNAIELLLKTPTAMEWISVREKLPEAKYGESENVLVTRESGEIGFLYFDGGNWCYPDGRCYGNKINPVIAWMPLPESYKGGDTE